MIVTPNVWGGISGGAGKAFPNKFRKNKVGVFI